MSVTRGDFLKHLGKSLPGLVLGGGVAAAAQKILGKVSAASGGADAAPTVLAAKKGIAAGAKVDFIRSGPATGNRVALTFDDGPTPGVTDLILDELQRRQLRATFFMIGQRIVESPELARRVLAEGHEIGNHTFTHPDLTTLAEAEADAEIQKTVEIMDEVLSYRAAWFRPPLGALRRNQAGLLAKRNLGVVLWNVDPRDWSQPGTESITATVLADTKPGAIILCHDLYRQTADGVGIILDGLVARGLQFTTLSTLLG